MRKFAVFDFDGTLVRWQLYHAIVDQLAKAGWVDEKSYRDVKDARLRWKTRESQDAFKDYEKRLIECYEKTLPKLTADKLESAINKVFDEHKQQVYVYSRNLLSELKDKGYFLIAISGSHREVVELIAKHYGFDDWVGTKYEKIEGKFTGKYQLAAAEKDIILNKLIHEHDLKLEESIGVGDSESDIPMLELVENPIAFNPSEKLFNHAKSKGWKIVVERKNVVYELENVDRNQKNVYHLS
ncbi:HAD family phosphatase [Candidatus Parcubacteria bacterium]|nr:HAD family phosphatase [Candidatus Parcubacteria bacterium]